MLADFENEFVGMIVLPMKLLKVKCIRTNLACYHTGCFHTHFQSSAFKATLLPCHKGLLEQVAPHVCTW